MHCNACDYALWNIRARQCPECGTPFYPSNYEFVSNAVQFCCPHCDQAYYGTDDKGHLSPRFFTCVSCDRQIGMDEMVLRPVAGLTDAQTRRRNMPWLERKKIGFIRGWLYTIGHSLVRPGRLIQGVPEGANPWQAVWFSMITFSAALFTLAVPFTMFIVIMGGWYGGVGGGPAVSVVGVAGVLIAAWVGGVIVGGLLIALWGLVTHWLIRLSGGTERTIGSTMSALFYSSGAMIINATPCFGMHLAVISIPWWIVSAVLMVRSVHGLSGLRATLCTATIPMLGILTAAGLYIWLVVTMMTNFAAVTAGGATSFASATAISETQIVSNAVLASASGNDGAGPAHASQLVAEGLISGIDLIGADTLTYEVDIPIHDVSLADFDGQTTAWMQSVAHGAAADVPDNVIAHRVGDFVFTYHGMDLSTPTAGLWIVIFSADPDTNAPDPFAPIVAGLADGTVQTYTSGSGALASQNAARAAACLPALPDPSTITHAQPARGN